MTRLNIRNRWLRAEKPTETSKNVSKMYLQLYLIKKVNFDAGILDIMMSKVHHG